MRSVPKNYSYKNSSWSTLLLYSAVARVLGIEGVVYECPKPTVSTVDSRQVRDTALCFFHTLLLHRTTGKFHYSTDTNYQIGSIGLQEVACEEIDLAYVRVNSPELITNVEKEVGEIADAVSTAIKPGGFIVGSSPQSTSSSPSPSVRQFGIERWENLITTQMKLEFYQKRRRQWPLNEETLPWEVWDLNLEVVRIESSDDFSLMRAYVGEKLGDTVLSICHLVNRAQYMPNTPNRENLKDVFNDGFTDCEPYLFRVESNLVPKRSDPNTRSGYFIRDLSKLTQGILKFS
ncbi:hypothetical protein M3Y94_00999600 [Aphelenchoides besseyi]|nr:hypothetical protein M3Y94_00999600 [Aphelenchoides besseyi]